jgi:hypothetical protein
MFFHDAGAMFFISFFIDNRYRRLRIMLIAFFLYDPPCFSQFI